MRAELQTKGKKTKQIKEQEETSQAGGTGYETVLRYASNQHAEQFCSAL